MRNTSALFPIQRERKKRTPAKRKNAALVNRVVQKPRNRGNGFSIKTVEFAAILRQIPQTCERTGRLSNKSN
jgi:hypothetical protein